MEKNSVWQLSPVGEELLPFPPHVLSIDQSTEVLKRGNVETKSGQVKESMDHGNLAITAHPLQRGALEHALMQ